MKAGRFSSDWITVLVLIAGFVIIAAWQFGGSRREPPPDTIGWRTDYQAGLQEAATASRPVLLNFTAEWCPPCQLMAHDVFPREDITQLVRGGFVPVKMDLTDSAGPAVDVALQYGVKGFPTYLIADAEGKEIARIVGAPTHEEFAAWLSPYAAAAGAAAPAEAASPSSGPSCPSTPR